MSQRRCNESESSSASSDYHWDGLPSPDVLRRYCGPKSWMERGAQTDSSGYAGPYRGLGIPHRGSAARGRASMAAHEIGDQMHGGCVGRQVYRPRLCGLCDHHHTFDTRTGLNNHSSKQHGYYYSLKGDCFVPLGEHSVRGHVPPPPVAQHAFGAQRCDQRFHGRTRQVLRHTRPPYPRGVPPVCYPREANGQFVTLQAVRSGIVTAWLQPQFLAFDAGEGVGIPATPLLPAVAGQSPTPSPGVAIPQMALADPLKREDVVDRMETASRPSLALNAMASIALDEDAPPVSPPAPELLVPRATTVG